MKPAFIEINWNEGWANAPDLIVHEAPIARTDFVYKKRRQFYFAYDRDTQQASYFSYTGPGTGFGGQHYHLKMVDGSTHELIGPWSSRASVMNAMGFPKSVECTYKTEKGYSYSGAILMCRAAGLLYNSGINARFVKHTNYRSGEQTYTLERTGVRDE
jgi:hypothetical protein